MGNTANILIGVIAMAVGAILLLWVIPTQTTPAIFASVPSRMYPDVGTWLMIVAGAALMISGVFATRERVDQSRTARQTVTFLIAVILLSVATLIMPRLGFVLTGAAISFGTVLLMGERRVPVLSAITILVPAAIWAAFVLLLGRPLP